MASAEEGSTPSEPIAPPEPISVRARFERFPATVKGAFVVRGEDPNPHLITFQDARIIRLGSRDTRPVGMKAGTLDIPPHQDVFMPFEFSISELESGWYALECEMDVDGIRRIYDGGRRFVVPWPRGALLRGTVAIGEKVSVGDSVSVALGQVDCSGDQATLRYSIDPADGGPVVIKLIADGERLAELETQLDAATGSGTLVTTPLLRAHRVLRVDLKRGRDRDVSHEVNLPE